MSNQQGPVNRPWFRLATMMRPPPPPPPQQPPPEPLPPPRPAFIRPTFRAQPPPQQSTSPPPPPTLDSPPPPAPPSPQIVARTPPPTMPSPRTIGTTPPPPTAAASSSPSPSPPQLPASNSSTIPSSPITNQPFPSFPSPKTTLSTPSPSTSPPPPSPSQTSLATTIARPTTPTFSPKTLGKTPPPSPNLKPPSHPPSPLTLPPPQLNSDTEQKTRSPPVFEQKTVLVQETNQKPKASPRNFNMFKPTINTNSPKHDSPKKNMNHKKLLDSEDSGTVIITISGDNKGAIMELSPSKKPTELGHINAHKSGSNSSNDTAKNKDQKAIPPPVTAFTNSNVQCVNNSILFNSSMTHHDPGVHFSVSRKPQGHHGNHLKD